MAFPTYNYAKWILDGFTTSITQRAVTDDDFADGEDLSADIPGTTWDSLAEGNAKMLIKRKYVSRRKEATYKMFKVCDGAYFIPEDISKYLKTTKQTPPDAYNPSPQDREISFPNTTKFDGNWFLVDIQSQFTKNGGVTITATWRKYYPWERVFVNS